MRNWNISNRAIIRARKVPFLPYLWGIEMGTGQGLERMEASFYPTYEELKFCKCVRKPGRCLRFYPTYEELKFGFSYSKSRKEILFLPYLWGIEIKVLKLEITSGRTGFYPTYEELKCCRSRVLKAIEECFYPTYEELKLKSQICM